MNCDTNDILQTYCAHTYTYTNTVCLVIYWLTAVVLGVCLVDGLLFNKYTFNYTIVLLLHLFFVTKFAPEFDSREKENIFYQSLHAISFVIYWLSAAILGLCLVWLLLTVEYTFIHTVVVLLLLSLVFFFICIIIKIAIDFFYDREIENPSRYIASYWYFICIYNNTVPKITSL